MGDAVMAIKLFLYCLPIFLLLDKGRVLNNFLAFLLFASPVLLIFDGILSAGGDSLAYLMTHALTWVSVGFIALRSSKLLTQAVVKSQNCNAS
jgi:hypothetical protein